ncbi:S8 family serine peptidase [Granulicella sp. WH15]|uniref:protease pro-enzyme activation domain-containing protein n=1 Tax=Granulicella sp. WH15 TaxID=2602070 RepID=UPI00136727DB|nr:Ig-like domain repeat protein [Granulicella sp. WH15]QHN03791.1 S8 family serine peptidase [Granulicella sp. WH15]
MLRIVVAAAIFVVAPAFAFAQSPISTRANNLVLMPDHVPEYVTSAQDQGPTADNTPIPNAAILLARSPEQDAALQILLQEQMDKTSLNFHRWLTPEEFASRFGASETAIEIVSGWLHANGFSPTVSRSKMYVSVSGNAAQFATLFHTTFHTFALHGQSVYSVTINPSVPVEVAPFIRSINGLTQHPDMAKAATPHRLSIRPDGTSSSGAHYITPADFAVIYDLNPVYKAGYSGAGQSIAIVGRSRVSNSDVQNFALATNLTLSNPQVVLPPGSIDPGETNNGDQNEATLDVTRASSVAPGASISLVISSAASGGYELAMQYVIDNQAASIMSVSFGTCEASAGGPSTDFYNALLTQGAVQGITTFISAGDGGVDACEGPDSVPSTTQIASINHLCASPNVICVGGTQLNDTANPSQYWNAANGAGHESAIGYIPEGSFNEPINLGTGATQIFAGSGGISTFIPAPSWQTGIPISSGGFRMVPDISFSSSGHDGYFICLTYLGYPCVANSQGVTELYTIAGTSAAAPSMAGIQALLNQQENAKLGNINPTLYSLAANPANGVFHDVTISSSEVTNCTVGTPSLCNNSTPSSTSLQGGEPGYIVGTGYDLATGWGSMDIYKLFQSWGNISKLAVATVDLTLSQTLVSAGQNVILTASMESASPVPTGTIQFMVDGQTIGGPIPLNSTGASLTYLVIGTAQINKVQAVYSGDSTYAAAVSGTMQFVITPLGSPGFNVTATPIQIGAPGDSGTSSVTISSTNGFSGTVTLGCITEPGLSLGSCVFSPASFTLGATPVQSALKLTSVAPSLRPAGAAQASATKPRDPLLDELPQGLALSLLGFLFIPRRRFTDLRKQIAPLALISILGAFLVACGHTETTITVVSALNPGTTQVPISFQAIVAGSPGGAAPTGSVQFLSNGLTIGAPVSLTNGAATYSQTFTTGGTYAISAQYLGDSSNRASLSSAINEFISYKNTGTAPGTYSLLVQATSGMSSQTVPVTVTVQ